jgi:hypothetical protein
MGAVLLTRRLAVATAALLLAGSGAVAVEPASAALPAPRCPGASQTFQAQTMGADDVFTGTVTDRAVQGADVVYTVEVDRVYKGDLDTAVATVTSDRSTRKCEYPRFDQGSPYVFFTRGADLTTSQEDGTAPATDARVAHVERLLGDGRAPTPPEPSTATFTRVASETTSLERVAAPGLALVIVGLLGLGLAVGLSRRRT